LLICCKEYGKFIWTGHVKLVGGVRRVYRSFVVKPNGEHGLGDLVKDGRMLFKLNRKKGKMNP
jgi:hypothetical protein